MADTNLTNLIVNSLTREQYHNADLTDHQNEVFVQSDHAGVHVGGSGVDALDTTNISNCITYIPQDIQLELNSGTLTLKAGSKVYVPNGSGVFDTITIANDLTMISDTNGIMHVFINQNGTLLFGEYNQESGTGTPANTWTTYYNTNDNKVYRYTTSTTTPSYQASLPIAKITVSNGAISSIDYVFNGFGYIGSTVFVLPGVKGLGPNGKNADGTLKSIEFTVTQVLTHTPNAPNIRYYCTLSSSNSLTSVADYYYYYDADENYSISNGNFSSRLPCVVCVCDTNNKIIDFKAKTVFHAVDYSEFAEHKLVGFQRPTSANNYTWYRKYSDGWVEQGRYFTNSVNIAYGGTGNLGSFTFPVAMDNTRYFCSASGSGYCFLMQWTKSTTACTPIFGAYTTDRTLSNVSVYVCGMAAS